MNVCYICGCDSNEQPIDHGNRLLVSCKSAECGIYQISNAAIKKVQNHIYARENYQPRIKKANLQERMAEIIVENGELVFIASKKLQ